MLGEIIDTLFQKSPNNYFVDDSNIRGYATLIGLIINIASEHQTLITNRDHSM